MILSVKKVSKPKMKTSLKMKFKLQTKLERPFAITLSLLQELFMRKLYIIKMNKF